MQVTITAEYKGGEGADIASALKGVFEQYLPRDILVTLHPGGKPEEHLIALEKQTIVITNG